MKRIIAIFFTLMLILALCCTAASEESTAPKFVTLREWLMNKGECGDCMLLLKIHDVMVDVLALAGDKTDQVTMYSGGASRVLSRALKAALESMCTSSMMYTLYFPNWGG